MASLITTNTPLDLIRTIMTTSRNLDAFQSSVYVIVEFSDILIDVCVNFQSQVLGFLIFCNGNPAFVMEISLL